MESIKVKANTFNGKQIEIKLNVDVRFDKQNTLLPVNVYSSIKENIKQKLNEDIDFHLISKDLENLVNRNITIDSDDFIEKLSEFIIKEVQQIGCEIKNDRLKRVRILVEEKKFNEAKELLSKIQIRDLSKFEYYEYLILDFIVSEDKDNKFDMYKDILKDSLVKLKELYFVYIKYLEDKRDEKKPRKLIREFEKIFSINELSDEEKTIFYYLKGRNEYLRGEFLDAINYFSKAKKLVKNETMLAKIYNSSANIFTDNLFFTEALSLANKALQIREDLMLNEEVAESLSLIGGIYFKKTQYKKSYEFFKKAESKLSNKTDRIYNYLAKSAIKLHYFNKAKEYLQKSLNYSNSKGFNYQIESLLYFELKDYNKLDELYKEVFFSNKANNFDKVVLGFFYYFLGISFFERGNNKKGLEFLYKSMFNFIEDLYILEAYYVYLHSFLYDIEDISLLENFDIKNKIQTYVKKHQNLNKDYRNIFDLEVGENNLLSFYKKTHNINRENINKRLLKDILNSINLM